MTGYFGAAARNLNEQLTYWASGGAAGNFGVETLAAPILIKGRWTDSSVEIQKPDGTEIVSRSQVQVDRPVTINGYLALGDHTATADPRTLDKDLALLIQAVGTVPDLRFMEQQRRAFL